MDSIEDVEIINISDDDEEIITIVDEDDDPVVLYSCYHCSQNFSSYRDLIFHIKMTPTKELETSLQKNTSRIFLNRNSVLNVIDIEKNKKKTELEENSASCEMVYICPLCSFKSSSSSEANNHVTLIHAGIQSFGRSMCNYDSTDKKVSTHHIKGVHKSKTFFNCKLCDYKGTHTFHLTRHMIQNHTENGLFKCTICNFKSVTAYSIDKHFISHHKK